ncbi:MAG: hypothetical protein SCH71_05750 [Desulfobulbaceae bacterium]|nr:hypothetical protein [Desulfobulbaceae bacterium]
MFLAQIPEQNIRLSHDGGIQRPTLVGGGLHVLNPRIETAVRLQDEPVLINRAKKEIAAGAQALAINLGPGKKMAESTPWVVHTLARAVDVPLFLSAGITAMDGVLEKYGARIIINAVTADPDTLADHFEIAGRHGTGLVVLLVKPGLVPTGTHARLQLASEVITRALETDFPLHQLYLDPVITCRPDPIALAISRGRPDIGPVLETLAFIRDPELRIKTIVALNNWSLGLSSRIGSAVHGRMLHLLAGAGLDAVILNCLDNSLMQAARKTADGHAPEDRDDCRHRLQ